LYQRIKEFVTVYGSGQVNINTAPVEVLSALGLSRVLVTKIMTVRRGLDGFEGTADDIIFSDANQIEQVLSGLVDLQPEEYEEIVRLRDGGKLSTQSAHYRIQAQGWLNQSSDKKLVTCVLNASDGKIVYWREKY
jgi:hypothetical protein